MSNIQILGASEVFICDETFRILQNGAIAFCEGEDKILHVGDFDELCALYSGANAQFFEHTILLPALVNAHIHFEFGAHIASFAYGDFGVWLDSLMARREQVLDSHLMHTYIKEGINQQFESGVGSVGAISSYGDDMELLAKSGLRVVYFNEAIGSNESMLDFFYSHLLERYERAKSLQNNCFKAALALHSPYSLHPIVARKVIALAAREQTPLSAHFLESSYEREWLEESRGYFFNFFQKLAQIDNPQSFYTPLAFLELFKEVQGLPIAFTHCLEAKEKEIAYINSLQASIVSCPRSNRLLNNTYFQNMFLKQDNPIAFGTDGKSSNYNVNLLDELRTALFAYPHEDLNSLARTLLLSATLGGARALGLNNGTLAQGKSVDCALFSFQERLDIHAQSPLQFILHAKTPTKLYINARLAYES